MSYAEQFAMEQKQRAEVRATNKKIEEATSLIEKVGIAEAHNQRGVAEGWLQPGKLDTRVRDAPFYNEAKVSKSEHCCFDTDILLHTPSLTPADKGEVVQLLNTPRYWWREDERRELWSAMNERLGVPASVLFLEEVTLRGEDAPATDLLGKVVNQEGKPFLFSGEDCRARYFLWAPAPLGFDSLVELARNGLHDGCTDSGYSYSTVRNGTCHTGYRAGFKFAVAVNGTAFDVGLEVVERGGSADRPSRYETDMTVSEATGAPEITVETTAAADVIFRNLARRLRANYPTAKSGVPLAGVI